jgi:hypothetical protein
MFAARVEGPAKSRSVPCCGPEAVVRSGQHPQANYGDPRRAPPPVSLAGLARRAGHSWDFSNIPLLAPDRVVSPGMFPVCEPLASTSASWPAEGAVQMKLVTGKSGDSREREADRVSAQMSDLPPNTAARGVSLPIQRSHRESTGHLAAAPSSVGRALASPGDPLEPALRQDMEHGFGHDFSGVRVHAGPAADRSALDIHAQAYTVGHDLVFAAGRFAPATHDGRRLIAHELTHVVQQHGAMPVVQRAPASDRRWTHDEAAARYRGRLMARRIKNHGKLSDEARAKINKELAYFQGSAKDAYLDEVRPALRSVTETEMPEERLVPQRPLPITLSLLGDDPRLRSFTDDQIYAPLKEAEQRDKDELAQAQAREMQKLKHSTAGWGTDQAFALELLRPLLERTTNVDPRAVSDKTREPILSRYRAWLTAVDKNRHEACLAMPSGIEGFAARSRARFQNDDPCVSWFANSSSHGPSELDDLRRILTLNRNSHTGLESPADVLYWDIFGYRKKTDPSMLEEERIAGQMLGALGNLTGMPGEGGAPGGAVPPEEVSPGGTVTPPATAGKGVPAEPSVSPEQPTPGVRPSTQSSLPPPTPDITAPKRPIGFRPPTATPPAPARADVPPPPSRPVSGFARESKTPPPSDPAAQAPPIVSQMPPARRLPSSASGQRGAGDARVATGQPTTAMAGKPPRGDKPTPISVGSSRTSIKGATRTPEVIDQELVITSKGPRPKAAPTPGVDPYQNYIQARDSAVRSAGLGSDQVPHVVESVGPGNQHLVGRQNGYMSPDGTRGWRLDYSPQKGTHINWWRAEGGIQYQGSTSINADEATFLNLLQGHFGTPPYGP